MVEIMRRLRFLCQAKLRVGDNGGSEKGKVTAGNFRSGIKDLGVSRVVH